MLGTKPRYIPLSGLLVRTKAKEFHVGLRTSVFKARTGWLDGFKRRNNITFKSMCGERASVNQETAYVWKDDGLQMMEKTLSKDIINIDEMGLFLKCIPDKTSTFKGDRCSERKTIRKE